MIESGYALSVIVVMALVTFALRALPFVAAQWLNKHALVRALGEFLPLAIMTLLLVHSLTGAALVVVGVLIMQGPGLWRMLQSGGQMPIQN